MAETAAHGHSHDDDGPRIGHDVTDHDHQHSAILPTTRIAHDIPDREAAGPTTIGAESVATRGPLRPPRA